MPLEVAAHAGFCMGVRRAVEVAMKVADTDVPSCTLGALIHNPTVVEMLRAHGIPAISTPEEAAGRQVLIRSHGVDPQTLDSLQAAGCAVLDLTCPFVDKLHRIVSEETGAISLAVGGMLKRGLTAQTLERMLAKELLNQQETKSADPMEKLRKRLQRKEAGSHDEE